MQETANRGRPVDEIPVSYVATHETDERTVYDHKTGERLAPHL